MKDFSKNYYDLLTDDYKGINLTRITDFAEFESKQIQDSIIPTESSIVFSNAIKNTDLVIDVGFGGGFPLLPLAYKYSDKNFLGIETRGKKVKVVKEISDKLGLTNVRFLHERIENVLVDCNAVITLKAVGKVYDFLSKINTTKQVKVFFYKGPNFYKLEEDQLAKVKKSWDIIEERKVEIPGTEGRLLIGFENKKVPCGTTSANQLVKVTSIK